MPPPHGRSAASARKLPIRLGSTSEFLLFANTGHSIGVGTTMLLQGADAGGTEYEWQGTYVNEVSAHHKSRPAKLLKFNVTCTKGLAIGAKRTEVGVGDCIVIDITLTNNGSNSQKPLDDIVTLVEP